MNAIETLNHISGTEPLTKEIRGYFFTTVFGRDTNVYDVQSIIAVSMSMTAEESQINALEKLKQLVFKSVCFVEGGKGRKGFTHVKNNV